MVNNLLDGANIQNCGDTNEIAVSITMKSISLDKKILNFLSLQPQEPSHTAIRQTCKTGYTGANCDVVVDACSAYDPCENKGICENKDSTYICNCPIHFTGDVCQHSTPIEFSSQYKGNGYIELNRSALVNSSNETDILLALLFSTHEPNGLLGLYSFDLFLYDILLYILSPTSTFFILSIC